MAHYCDLAPNHPLHGLYHDKEYGFPDRREHVIFERMALEIMQAGLSWEIVLKKRAALKRAFEGFKVSKVAKFGDIEVANLLLNDEIIRNQLKIRAIIHNAGVFLTIRSEYGGIAKWLDSHHPRSKEGWVKLFRANFKFMGPEIVGEFLMSLGYLPGAHRKSCPIYKQIQSKRG